MKKTFVLWLFITACWGFVVSPVSVIAAQPAIATTTPEMPTPTRLVNPPDAFVEECKGQGVDVSCIYAEGILALHLRRGDGKYISSQKGMAQVWNDAWNTGQVIGILAHNYAGGQKFGQLYSGKTIYLIWTDGTVEEYRVYEQALWRVLDNWLRFSPWNGGAPVSDVYLRTLYYRGGNNFNKMVLQTCVGNQIGVLFVVAYRLDQWSMFKTGPH